MLLEKETGLMCRPKGRHIRGRPALQLTFELLEPRDRN